MLYVCVSLGVKAQTIECRRTLRVMQSFLSASAPASSHGRKSPAAHHGAHHPLADFSPVQQKTAAPWRLSSVHKLVLFGLGSLILFLYIFMTPSASSSPFEGASKLNRGDRYTPSPLPVDPVESFFAPSPPIVCPNELFDRSEIQKHTTDDNLWIVMRGAVLNVTRFVSAHPGGAAILEGAKQDDAASLFVQFHSPSTTGLLSSFCIGRVRL